jgi:chemotaxis protein MotA
MDKLGTGGYAAFWVLILVTMAIGVGIIVYIDIPSVIVVLGGTAANILASYESSILKNLGKAIKAAFAELGTEDNINIIQKIIFYATEIKKNGKMAIEPMVEKEKDPFIKEAFSLVVDGTKSDTIEYLLETKVAHMEVRHAKMIQIFAQISDVAGAMGMVGTLIGLVAMLANLADPSAVGPAMAVALLTTLYGSLLGVGFAGPIGNRLAVKSQLEVDGMNIITQGVLLIAQDEPIGDMKIKLNAILSDR